MSPTVEEWRPCAGSMYEVSSMGRVRRDGRVLTPRRHSNGYLRICFSDGKNRKDKYIHRLVCEAFHGRPPADHYHADHENGIRDDNRSSNLQWMSPADNRSRRTTPDGYRRPVTSLSKLEVDQIRSAPKTYGYMTRLVAMYGIHPRAILNLRKGGYSHVNFS